MQRDRKEKDMEGFVGVLNAIPISALAKMANDPSSARYLIEDGKITECFKEEIPTQTANPSGDNK